MTTTAPKTLILADDHGIVREGISAFCKARPDLEIVGECGDGQAAVEMILDLVPQFAVLDLNMPKMGGLEVIHKDTPNRLSNQVDRAFNLSRPKHHP